MTTFIGIAIAFYGLMICLFLSSINDTLEHLYELFSRGHDYVLWGALGSVAQKDRAADS